MCDVAWCLVCCLCCVCVFRFYHAKYVLVRLGDSLCDAVGHGLCACVIILMCLCVCGIVWCVCLCV